MCIKREKQLLFVDNFIIENSKKDVSILRKIIDIVTHSDFMEITNFSYTNREQPNNNLRMYLKNHL